MTKKHTILVVAAHPDDEVLGVGGTLLKLSRDQRVALHLLFLSLGEASRVPSDRNEARRKRQAQQVAAALGATIHFTENFPDNAFDSVPLLRIVQAVESSLTRIRPTVIYTHHAGDLNIDHELTFRAVFTACRPSSAPQLRALYTFEVLSSTEWQAKGVAPVFFPSLYINIEPFLEEKIRLLQIYGQEMSPYPFPRSAEGVRTLAMVRGMESGLRYAEAFTVIREVES